MTNANQILFRSSGAFHLIGDVEKGSAQLIPIKVIKHLIDLYCSAHHGRREEISHKFLTKGNQCEEDGITLLSRVLKFNFKKNKTRLNNEFITGEPDLFLGPSVEKATETYDTKLSWSLHTFLRAKFQTLDDAYYWQGQCYMWLTGAKRHTVAFCLVNGTPETIDDEKRAASYRIIKDVDGLFKRAVDAFGNETEGYRLLCKQIEINHIFDIELFRKHNPYYSFHNDVEKWEWDIPMEDRVHQFVVERNDQTIERLKTRIRVCRNYMNREFFNL